MWMSRMGMLALGLLPFIGGSGQERDNATLTRLIRAYFDAVADKNFVRLDSAVTRDFVIYEGGKAWNNDSVYRNIQYNQPFSVKFTLTDFHIFIDTRSAEARYHERADFVVRDTAKFTLNFLSTANFRKTAAGWRISLLHVTTEEPPEVGMPRYYYRFDTVRFIPMYYQKRLEVFRKEPVNPGGTVMLGTSITEYGDWKQLLGDPNVVNRGIAGDNTFGMLERLGEVISRKPAQLYIEAGINDIGQDVPVGMIAGNIESIAQYVRVGSPRTRISVVSVLPTNEKVRNVFPMVAGKNAAVRELDALLREAAGPMGYAYIDLAAKVTDGAGNLEEQYAREDGLHLNAKGYGNDEVCAGGGGVEVGGWGKADRQVMW